LTRFISLLIFKNILIFFPAIIRIGNSKNIFLFFLVADPALNCRG